MKKDLTMTMTTTTALKKKIREKQPLSSALTLANVNIFKEALQDPVLIDEERSTKTSLGKRSKPGNPQSWFSDRQPSTAKPSVQAIRESNSRNC